jgi:hypothetical protein
MNFNKIILVSDTPKDAGLAYYYNLALKDTFNTNNVFLIDNFLIQWKYLKILNKYINYLFNILNIKQINIINKILDKLQVNDSVIVIFFNNGGLNTNFFNKLRKVENLFLINFLSDHPYGLQKSQHHILKQSAHLFDLLITFSTTINPILYRFGAKKVFNLPFAYCKYTHYIGDEILQQFDNNEIHYYGTWTKEIEDILTPLLDYNLKIHGGTWDKSKNKHLRNIALNSSKSYSRNMIKSARNAKLVINFTRAPHMCLHTMKTFELTIAGACVISNFSYEQNYYHPNNDSMVFFNTKEQMLEKINYYLFNDDENIRIRKNAFLNAKENNYHNRSQELINYLSKI